MELFRNLLLLTSDGSIYHAASFNNRKDSWRKKNY